MEEARLVALLAELTGSLTTLNPDDVDSLQRVRYLVANALQSGQTEAVADARFAIMPRLDEVAVAELEEIRKVATDVASSEPDNSLRVYRRTWPALVDHQPRSVPVWASGWAPVESIGPFESPAGQLVWFDIRKTGRAVVVVDRSGRLHLTLPYSTPVDVFFQTQRLDISAGSAWFSASAFAPLAPEGSRVGVRIVSGTVDFSRLAGVVGTRVVVEAGTVITLRLQLAPDESPQRSRYGGDSRALESSPVTEVTIALDVERGARLHQVGSAALDVFGSRLNFRGSMTAAPRYDAELNRLWFPMSCDRDRLSIAESHSQAMSVAGEAMILEAGWTVPVTPASTGGPNLSMQIPSTAGSAGALGLVLASGLDADGEALPTLARLASTTLLARPGQLSICTTFAASNLMWPLELWDHQPNGQRSQLQLRSQRTGAMYLDSTTAADGAEAWIISPLECTASVDRPLAASGDRVPFYSESASLEVVHAAGQRRIHVFADGDYPRDPISGVHQSLRPLSFALSNAFVAATEARTLRVGGVVAEPWHVMRGLFALEFRARFLMHILPDPYAASITREAPRDVLHGGQERGQLGARVRWSETLSPQVRFALSDQSDFRCGIELAPLSDKAHDRAAEATHDRRGADETARPREFPEFLRLHEASTSPDALPAHLRGLNITPEFLRLLDVSTNADLFGVGLVSHSGRPAEFPAHLSGLDLTSPLGNVWVFTLPAFHWEPVYNIPNPDAAPFPDKLESQTDGGPTHFATTEATLVPVAPAPAIDTLLDEYNTESATVEINFTLPFGIAAATSIQRTEEPNPFTRSPGLDSLRPEFQQPNLLGAQQLAVRAPRHRILTEPGAPSPGLPGRAFQIDNCVGDTNILDSGFVDDIFNATFFGTTGAGPALPIVPIQRIDFSGYGATVFSDWRHADVDGSGITQVKFEAMIGRTAREVVQVRSKLYPWGAVVVRTITIERTGSGGVFRRDSGWQAASDARYDVDGIVHSGVLPRLTNIRRIRDTSTVFEHTSSDGLMKLTRVVFDADVQIEGVTLGANNADLVPTRDITGYVQVLPIGQDLSAGQLDSLIAATGPIGGPIDCELNIGQSGLHMRLSRIEVDRTESLGGFPEFVAVARGTAHAGEWTFVRRAAGEHELRRLDANQPIPLIRSNPSGGVAAPYRIADASELHRPSGPVSEYGLLHSSGAQRLLIPQPQVEWGDATLYGGAPMLFADIYALAGGIALFPRPERCHPLPAGSALVITGRGKVRLDVATQPELAPGEFKVGVAECTLSQSATMRIRSRFASNATIRLVIDSDRNPDWECTFGPIAAIGDIGDFDELIQTVGTMSSSSHAAPKLTEPKMVFGGPLAPVQTIISFLTAFGLPFPFDISVTNQTYGFKSGWKYKFPLFGLVEEKIKLGLGLMLELEMVGQWGKESEDAKVIGKEISEHSLISTRGIPKGPDAHNWHFYFEGEAKILGKAISLAEVVKLYMGGVLKVGIGGEEDGKTVITIFGGYAGVVEGDVGVLEVSGGRGYTFGIQHLYGQKKVAIGASSEWNVEAAFLKGLAAVEASFELLTLIHPADDWKFEGKGTIAIDVTLAWALSKTVEVEVDFDETVAKFAFIANTVLR
jgi:hypothetical protein